MPTQLILVRTDPGRAFDPRLAATPLANNFFVIIELHNFTYQAAWQQKGNEVGSSVGKTPSDATIIAWAKAKLGIN